MRFRQRLLTRSAVYIWVAIGGFYAAAFLYLAYSLVEWVFA